MASRPPRKTLRSAAAWSGLSVAVIGLLASVWAHSAQWQLDWLDEALHAYVPMAVTLVLVVYLYGTVLTGRDQHPLLFVLMVAAVGIALGAVWEIVEWVYDGLRPGNVIRGKLDTMIDLSLDALAGLAAGLIALWLVPADES